MKVEAATSGMPMQLWQQQQQMQYEQRLISNAQMLGSQYPNSETQPPNAVPPPDAALRVIQQVDRTPVVLNNKSREEARAYFQNYQDRVRETRDQMDSSKAIFDQNAGKEVRQYNPGDYFDVDA